MRFALVPCALLLVTFAAAPARAQQAAAPFDRGYLHLNVGGQTGSNDFNQPGSFPLYDETAVFNVAGEVGGGALIDIGGGYRVWRQLYVGVSYSRSSDTSGATLTGQVPDPLVTSPPAVLRPISGSVSGLKHTEHAVHLQAVWRQPIRKSIDAAVFLGPTFFTIDQDVISAFAVVEPGPSLGPLTTTSLNESTTGFHIGADVSYRITPRFAAGVLLRYAGGSVDLPVANQETSLDVGGVHFGVGVRAGF